MLLFALCAHLVRISVPIAALCSGFSASLFVARYVHSIFFGSARVGSVGKPTSLHTGLITVKRRTRCLRWQLPPHRLHSPEQLQVNMVLLFWSLLSFALIPLFAGRSHGTKHILVCRRIASRRYPWPRNRSRDVAFLAPQVHRTLGGSPLSSSWKDVVGRGRRGRPHALSALQSTAMLLICSLLCTCHLSFLQYVVCQDRNISNASGHNLETMDGSCRHGLFPSLTTTHPAVSCFEWLCDYGDDYAPALIAAVGNLLCTSSHQGYGFAFPFVCRNCGVRVCLCNCISKKS